MTRKDFLLLSAALRNSRIMPHGNAAQDMARREQFDACVMGVAHALANETKRFDRLRFMVDAGAMAIDRYQEPPRASGPMTNCSHGVSNSADCRECKAEGVK